MPATSSASRQPNELTGAPAMTAVAALIAVMFMASTLVTPLYVLYEKTFHFSEITLTLVYAVYVIGNLGSLLFLGRLSDQIGRRRVGLPAIALAATSTLLFLFARGTSWLFAARMLSGLSAGLVAGTAAAWLADMAGEGGKTRATIVATFANVLGLAIGSLLAGLLAQYVPGPLYTPFLVYLALLAVVALLVARTPETVRRAPPPLTELSLRPRLGVPAEKRTAFVAPAVTALGCFALFGFYAALAPSLVVDALHRSNHAIGGLVVFELSLVAALTVIAAQRLASRSAMLTALMLLLPSLALLVLAQGEGSLLLLVAGTAISGVSFGLGYRGSLQVANQIAPAERRAEVVSCYFLACFFGNSVPVIGVGVLRSIADPLVASGAFAVTIALFAVAALVAGLRRPSAAS